MTELTDLVCVDCGLSTAAGTERTAALLRLNHAYRQLVQQAGGLPSEVTIAAATAGTADELDLSSASVSATLAGRFLALDRVRFTSGGVTTNPVARATPVEIRDAQNDGGTGTPQAYAFVFPSLMLDRALDGATDVVIDARLGPLTLVETSPSAGVSESTPTAVPVIWHERLLAALACCLVLERYEGREQDAAYHRSLYNEALLEYRAHRAREGGDLMPGSSLALWDTPTNIGMR